MLGAVFLICLIFRFLFIHVPLSKNGYFLFLEPLKNNEMKKKKYMIDVIEVADISRYLHHQFIIWSLSTLFFVWNFYLVSINAFHLQC